uniref:Uncharacterized protein n=1 Tax=Rhizophagus irregularis (strain DAOM 181602 / DAOM 197198 / MUCL 43194) TaxID=747089 RepID=U9V6V8_RHIID
MKPSAELYYIKNGRRLHFSSHVLGDAQKKIAYTPPRPSLDYDQVSEVLITSRQYTGNK